MFSEKKIAFIHLLQEIVLFITYFESFLDNLDIKHMGACQKHTPMMSYLSCTRNCYRYTCMRRNGNYGRSISSPFPTLSDDPP